jgi:hypothetical protein
MAGRRVAQLYVCVATPKENWGGRSRPKMYMEIKKLVHRMSVDIRVPRAAPWDSKAPMKPEF